MSSTRSAFASIRWAVRPLRKWLSMIAALAWALSLTGKVRWGPAKSDAGSALRAAAVSRAIGVYSLDVCSCARDSPDVGMAVRVQVEQTAAEQVEVQVAEETGVRVHRALSPDVGGYDNHNVPGGTGRALTGASGGGSQEEEGRAGGEQGGETGEAKHVAPRGEEVIPLSAYRRSPVLTHAASDITRLAARGFRFGVVVVLNLDMTLDACAEITFFGWPYYDHSVDVLSGLPPRPRPLYLYAQQTYSYMWGTDCKHTRELAKGVLTFALDHAGACVACGSRDAPLLREGSPTEEAIERFTREILLPKHKDFSWSMTLREVMEWLAAWQ